MTGGHGLDPALDVRLGGRRASVTIDALAASAGVPVARLRGALLSLLLTARARAAAGSPCPSPSPPAATEGAAEGEPTEGKSRRSGRCPTFPKEEEGPETFPTSGRSDAREGRAGPSLAQHVARSLGDEANLAAIASAVRGHPEALVLRALDVALDLPADRVRVSRGAYFTGVLAKLDTNPPPYARTSSAST